MARTLAIAVLAIFVGSLPRGSTPLGPRYVSGASQKDLCAAGLVRQTRFCHSPTNVTFTERSEQLGREPTQHADA